MDSKILEVGRAGGHNFGMADDLLDSKFEGKRRGRPPNGKVRLGDRVSGDLVRRVQEFADSKFMDRADAVADLLERGLRHGEE